MSYQLTDILDRCTRQDVDFLIDIIDSYVNFSDDQGLKELAGDWNGTGTIPLELNKKLETEIRYLGSNDFAYMTRKMRGYEPAGVSVDEIIDDLSDLLKLKKSTASTLEARLEIFSCDIVDKQFSKLSDERKREIINSMKFDKHHRDEIIKKVIDNKELIMPIILPILGKTIGPEVLQSFIVSILSTFIGKESAQALFTVILSRVPTLSPLLGPLMIIGTGVWTLYDISGPASRKTITLMLYLGILCLRDGETKEFIEDLNNK